MENKKIEEVAKIIAAEEVANDPKLTQKSEKEIQNEIIKTLLEEQKKRDKSAETIIDILDRVKDGVSGGGFKAILLKFLMYFLLPLIILLGLGYLGWLSVQNRKVFVNLIKGVNNSNIYKDKKTKWKIRVRELIPDIQEDRDKENFNKVKEKMKEVYGS